MLEQKTDRTFLSKAQERMRHWNELMEIRGTRSDLPLKPQVVARALNEYLDRDAIICSDTGTITTWAARHIHDSRGHGIFRLGDAGHHGQWTGV